MNRRRFLQITAAAALGGRAAGAKGAADWRGRAFGAEVAVSGLPETARAALLAEIAAIEATFSLYRESELTRLNAAGRGPGSAQMRAVLALAGRVHAATGGAFDPTVGRLWAARAARAPEAEARAAIGFARVEIGREIRLGPGQALTLNGVVQGYAADRVAALLEAAGAGPCLIDMGEFVGLGGRFRLGVEDPAAGLLGAREIGAGAPRAIATSSPGAMRLGAGGHILGPQGQTPRWSTVAVEGGGAALCDAASTGFVLMEAGEIARARDALGLGTVTLIDAAGDLVTL